MEEFFIQSHIIVVSKIHLQFFWEFTIECFCVGVVLVNSGEKLFHYKKKEDQMKNLYSQKFVNVGVYITIERSCI